MTSQSDATDLVLRFREAARHLWNTGLANGDADVQDEFDEICAVLFRVMVLRPLGRTDATLASSSRASPEALRFLRVVPVIDVGTPILINREAGVSYGRWDDPITSVKPNDVDLRFVRLFDWDESGQRDFEYILVVIEGFLKHEGMVGRHALIAPRHVRVLLEPERSPHS
jgi:hypothetical protein